MEIQQVVTDRRAVVIAPSVMGSAKGKRVRFATSLISFESDSKRFRDFDVQSLWWSRSDIEFFKMDAQLLAEQAMQNEILNNSIQQAYECAGRISSATKDEQRLCQRLQTMEFESCLSVWINRHSSRGTERRVLKKHSCRKNRDRNLKSLLEHRSTVFSNQGKLNDEQLRNKCLKLSRQERAFARMMGIADAVSTQSAVSCRTKSGQRRCRFFRFQ